jgi:hypothetical protein
MIRHSLSPDAAAGNMKPAAGTTPSLGDKKAVAATPDETGFIDTPEMLRRLPVSGGTLRNWRTKGKIPFVRLTGRRVLWHWPSVTQALLRMQRGGTN